MTALALDYGVCERRVSKERKKREEKTTTYSPDVFKELQPRRPEQIIPDPLLPNDLQHGPKQIILDQEAIIKIVILVDGRPKEPQRRESEVFMARGKEFGNVRANGGGEDKVFGTEGVVRDEEAEEVA